MMTTPATNTPYAIICDALGDAKKIRLGQVPSSELIAEGMRKLNDMTNLWQTQGIKLWLIVDTEIPLTAGTPSYTLKPGGTVDMTKPLRVEDGYYLDASGNRRPLFSVARSDWIKLPQPASNGSINQYFVDKQATQLVVWFWQTPDATAAAGEAHVILRTQIANPVSLTETMLFPPEWRMALRWGLAEEWSVGQPPAIVQHCAGKARETREVLEGWDTEDAPVTYALDQRFVNQSRFR